jgi:hypothetical protein
VVALIGQSCNFGDTQDDIRLGAEREGPTARRFFRILRRHFHGFHPFFPV